MKKKLDYNKYIKLRNKYESIVNRFSNIRMIMFIIMIISFILKYYYYKLFFSVVFVISLVIFFIMVMVHDKYFKIYDYYIKYVSIIERYIDMENGNWKNFSDTGSDFLDDNKMYLSDLDIIGESSLFQYLSICKTLGGRKKLISRLSNFYCNEKELINKQKMIVDLSNNISFCIDFQIMMMEYEECLKDFDEFFIKNKKNSISSLIIGILFSAIGISLFVLGLSNVISINYFYLMFLFNILMSYMYFYISKDMFLKLDKFINSYGKLINVFKLIGNYSASSIGMKKIVKNVENNLDILNKLKKLDSINSLRNNLLSNFLLNGFICINLFIMYYYSLFINKYFNKLIDLVEDIYELEASISLVGIGILKDNRCIPVLSDKVELKFDNLKHPLIDENICTSNDFDCDNGVNIITGSNMGGKTTFLRTIGINLILMQAGTYVCSNSFISCYFKIFTSMRIRDDVNKGISTFYGELLRIKDMVEYNGSGNMLVLVDEIFKGTNYNDRMYGAREVVNRLNNKSTLAFITTHDFELCDSEGVSNYHVKEDYEGEKIIFDYKIRKGRCTSTNAKYLMGKLGIINIK